MIVKNEETLGEALQMLESGGPTRYSDEYSYIIIATPETLELQCRRAFARNSFAIVVPLGQEHEMEVHAGLLPSIREERRCEELRRTKAWVREHPEIVAKFEKSLKKGEKRGE